MANELIAGLRLFVKLAVYVLYRIVYHSFDCANRYRSARYREKQLDQDDKIKDGIEEHRLLWKMKFDEFECTRGCDLLGSFVGYVDREQLLDPDTRWSLYTVDKSRAYFVRTKQPLREYDATRVPFVYPQQFNEADRLIVMHIKQFVQLFNNHQPDRASSIVYVSNCPRSGTTLLSALLQADGKVTSLSEPDSFTNLAQMAQRNACSDREIADIIDATFRAYLITIPHSHTVFIKTQSNADVLVPYMRQYLPSVQHLFVTRRNVRRGIISTERMLKGYEHDVGLARMLNTLQTWMPRPLLDKLLIFNQYEGPLQYQLRPKTSIELSWIIYAAPYARYLANPSMYDGTSAFEDMLAQPEQTLTGIYQTYGCEVDRETVAHNAKRLDQDSQANTGLSQAALAKVSYTEMTDELRIKSKEYARVLNLPENYFADDSFKAEFP